MWACCNSLDATPKTSGAIMTLVRAHIKGKALKDIRTKTHAELELTVTMFKAVQEAMDDEAFRKLTMQEWPELAFFPADGGMI